MAALILQVWMYSIQYQDAGGWSVSPWKRLIRVRHHSLWCLLFCMGIYTCNCTTKTTKPAQLRELDCERLQPLEGGICSNHRVITRFRFRMMERCHFVFPWCVTHSRRTEDCLKFSASPLTQHHVYFLPWNFSWIFFFGVRWFVAGRTGPLPFTQHPQLDYRVYLWLAALVSCPEQHKSGLQLWLHSSTLISLLTWKIR